MGAFLGSSRAGLGGGEFLAHLLGGGVGLGAELVGFGGAAVGGCGTGLSRRRAGLGGGAGGLCLDLGGGRVGEDIDPFRQLGAEGRDPVGLSDRSSSAPVTRAMLTGAASSAVLIAVQEAGAEKISLVSMAVRDPQIIAQAAGEFGRQAVVQSMQVRRVPATAAVPSGYEVMVDGARVATGMDAVEWARRGERLSAGEIVVNSIDQDGTHQGYDLVITGAIADAVNVPMIASGGAGTVGHVAAAFRAGASAAIISSLLYSPRMERTMPVGAVKHELARRGLLVRR